jgi:hypothetical protein
MRLRRPPRQHIERPTLALAGAALGTVGAVVVLEVGRVWKRGSAPLPADAPDLLDAAAVATRETREVAVAAIERASDREGALLNLFASFVIAFATARVSSHQIRRRGRFGPFRDLRVGHRHVHHFVPGLLLSLGAGAWSILSADEGVDPLLALPFGVGLGLTLDESALLLELEDVYWSQEGVLSIQIGLTTTALLGGAVIARRVLRRGEEAVLEAP